MRIVFRSLRVLAWAIGGLLVPAVIWAAVGGPVYTKSENGTAFTSQLGKNAAAGRVLKIPSTGTDTSGAIWADDSSLPSGTPGQVAGVVAGTATQTVSLTGTQTGTGTQTHTYATTNTGTITGTQTATGATATYTHTATSTLTSIASVESFSVGIAPTALASSGNGSVLYVLGETKMERYSVASNPLAPSYLGETSLYGDTNIAACTSEDGSYVFAGSYNRVQIFTSAGSYVGYAPTSGSKVPTGCAVKSNRLYVTLGYSGNAQIQTFDVSTIGSPVSLGVVNSRSQPVWGADISGTNLFGAGLNRTLEVFSISDPNSPSSLGYTSAGTGLLYDLALIGTKAVLADYSADKLVVVDITTPSAPSYVTNFTVGDQPAGIVIRGNYAYVCHTSLNACRIYDASMYGSPITVTATQTTTGTKTVTNTLTNATTGTNTGTQTYSGTSTFTASATGTGTTTETSWKAVNPPFDELGTYYLAGEGQEGPPVGPAWARWNELANTDTFEASAVCSSGSDGLIGTVHRIDNNLQRPETRGVWPMGLWMAELRAKVNANGAGIRIEVWDATSETQWFNWTTDAFANTSYATITKTHIQSADIVPAAAAYLYFKLYATCSTPSTVTVDFASQSNGFATKLRSPAVAVNLRSTAIQHGGAGYTVHDELFDLANWRYGVDQDIGGLQERVGILESARRISRRVFLQAGYFRDYTGGTAMAVGTPPNAVTAHRLDNGVTSSIYSASFVVPSDFSSSMQATIVWMPTSTDADDNHTVRWSINYKTLAAGTDPTAAGTTVTWTGVHCSYGSQTCTANVIRSGDWFNVAGVSADDVLRITVSRIGADAADTLAGNLYVLGLSISYGSLL